MPILVGLDDRSAPPLYNVHRVRLTLDFGTTEGRDKSLTPHNAIRRRLARETLARNSTTKFLFRRPDDWATESGRPITVLMREDERLDQRLEARINKTRASTRSRFRVQTNGLSDA